MHRMLLRRAAVALVALTVLLLPIAGSERRAGADTPPVTRFRFEQALSWVREGPGAQVCIKVVREGDTSAQQTVEVYGYSTSVFYGFEWMRLTFAPGVTERTINWPGASCLSLPDNSSDDGIRTATLELSIPYGSSALTSWPSRHRITIVDDDGPARVTFAQGYWAFDADLLVREGGGLIQIPLLRSGDTSGSFSVECQSYDHSDATRRATLGADYDLPGWTADRRYTATFGAGEWVTSCPVEVLDDAASEGIELLPVYFSTYSLPPGVGYGLTGLTLGILDDDNPGTVQFTQPTLTAYEYSPGELTIPVTRSGGANGPASVTCRLSSSAPFTATAGSDFTFAPQTLSWSDGDDLQKPCRITIHDDAEVEEDETIILELADATGALLGSPPTIVIRIQSNDSPGQFRTGNVEVLESAGTFQVSVLRDGGAAGEAAVTCRLRTGAGAGTASTPADFTFSEQRLTWNAGEVGSKTCSGTLVNDTVAESNETIVIDLVDPAGATIAPPGSAVVTILDDDGPGTIRFEVSGLNWYWPPSGPPEYAKQVPESAGTVRLRVERVNGSAGAVSVTCQLAAAPGSATLGSDYTFVSQPLTWADGETASQECELAIIDDSAIEQEETVRLQLANPSGGAVLGEPATVAVLIVSDDGPGHLSFDTVTGNREGDPPGSYTVRRTGGSSGQVSVVCRLASASFTATPGVDFTFTQQTLTWDDGDTAPKPCNFAVIDDALIEQNETVRLELVNPTGGATVWGGTVEFWIYDNDHPVVTAVSPASGPIAGGTPITISGYNFTGATRVTVDSVECTGMTVVSDTTITCTTPPRPGGPAAAYGPVSVVVHVPVGQWETRSSPYLGTADDFLYYGPGPAVTQLVPAATTCNGQHWVVVRGTRFFTWGSAGAASLQVRVGGQLVDYQQLVLGFGESALLVLAPPLPVGTYRVAVTTVEGTSADVAADDLTCAGGSGSTPPPATSTPAPITAAPAVSGVVPSSGVCDGTLQVAVLGTAFTSGATVTFGGAAATVTYVNQNTLVIRPAARAPGQVDIRVTTPNGTSPNTAADDFTCLAPPAQGGSNPGSGGTGGTGGTGSTPGGSNPGSGTGTPGTGGSPDPATITPGPVTYTLYATYTLIAWAGPDNASIAALLAANPTIRARISAIWTFDPVGQRWLGYFPGSENVPGANDFSTLRTGRSYFIAIRPGPSPVSWLVSP